MLCSCFVGWASIFSCKFHSRNFKTSGSGQSASDVEELKDVSDGEADKIAEEPSSEDSENRSADNDSSDNDDDDGADHDAAIAKKYIDRAASGQWILERDDYFVYHNNPKFKEFCRGACLRPRRFACAFSYHVPSIFVVLLLL